MKTPESIFVLKMKCLMEEELKYPAGLERYTLGYFTDLEKAEYFLLNQDKNSWVFKNSPFKIFVLHEHEANTISLNAHKRIYNKEAQLLGEIIADHIQTFKGRDVCTFKIGDIVEFESHKNTLNVGIIAGLPPTEKRAEEINKAWNKKLSAEGFSFLDSSNDSYLLLTEDDHHQHINVHYCFKPCLPVPEALKKRLKQQLLKG